MGEFYKSKRILIIKTKNIMETVILSMAIFAFISTILILIDLFRTMNKINEIIKALECDLQKIEKEIENLKKQITS